MGIPQTLDRVKDTTATTGAGTLTLSGAAPSQYQPFAVIGDGNSCNYFVGDQGGANWEVTTGVFAASGNTLTRAAFPFSSSNTTTGSVVNVTIEASGLITAVTPSAHGLSTGQFVCLTGVGGVAGANGYWLVTVLSITTFKLAGSFGSGVYTSGGTWTAYSKVSFGAGTKDVWLDVPAYQVAALNESNQWTGANNYFSGTLNIGIDTSATNAVLFMSLGTPDPALPLETIQTTVNNTGSISGWRSVLHSVNNYNVDPASNPLVQNVNTLSGNVNYGVVGTTPAIGTCLASSFTVDIKNSGNHYNETSPTFFGSFNNTNNNAVCTTPGRQWLVDGNLGGPVLQQQSCQSGFHLFHTHYYNGPPLQGEAHGSFWALTGGFGGAVQDYYHTAAVNYPIGTGYGLCGYSRGAMPGTTVGYRAAIQVGGSGSNWGIRWSHVGNGAEISDCDGAAVFVRRKYGGLTSVQLTGKVGPALPTIAAGGTGYGVSQTFTVTLVGGTGTAAQVSVTCNAGGVVTTVNSIVAVGSYVVNPPASGCAVTGGSGTGLTLNLTVGTNGGSYTSPPTVTLAGGSPGFAALVRARLLPTSLAAVAVTTPGYVYTSLPTLTVDPPFPIGTTATAVVTTMQAILIGTQPQATGTYTPSSTFNITATGGTFSTAAVVNVTTDASGHISVVNSITTPGSYTVLPANPVTMSGGTGVTVNATFTISWGILAVSVTGAGSGYTALPAVTVTGGGLGFGAVLTPTLTASPVGGIFVDAPGTGYGSNPTVTFSAGVTTALGYATVGGIQDGVAHCVVTFPGAQYSALTPPTITFTRAAGDTTGGNAAGTAVINAQGEVVGIYMTNPGTLYTKDPTVTIQAPPTQTATGTAVVGLLSAAVSAGGTSYTVGDVLTVTGGTSSVQALLTVLTAPGGVVGSVSITRVGSYSSLSGIASPAAVTGGTGTGATFTLTWSVTSVTMTAYGGWYSAGTPPAVTFGAGTVTALGTAHVPITDVCRVVVTNGGSYTTAAGVPAVTFAAPPAGGVAALAKAVRGGAAIVTDADAGPSVFGSTAYPNYGSNGVTNVAAAFAGSGSGMTLIGGNSGQTNSGVLSVNGVIDAANYTLAGSNGGPTNLNIPGGQSLQIWSGGGTSLAFLDAVGCMHFSLNNPSFGLRKQWWWQSRVGTAVTIDSFGNAAPTVNGAAATNSQTARGDFANYVTTSTTINLLAGWTPAVFTMTQLRYNPTLTAVIEFPNANDITSCCVWVGFSTASITGAGFDATAPTTVGIVAFRFNSATDGGVWHLITNVGGGSTTPTNGATGVAVAVATRYVLRIDTTTSGFFYCWINDGLVGQPALSTAPATTTGLGVTCCNRIAVAGNTHSISISRLEVSQAA